VTRFFALLFTVLLAGAGSLSAGELKPEEIDALVHRALQQWKVPGAAVAIVHGERVVHVRGYGLRAQGKDDPVTENTLFPLASCTKGFTATALAMLADAGKVSWDDRVRKHVPFFQLSDPLADREVRLRDLACHRTGLGRHDFLWYRSPWSQKEIIRRVRYLPLSQPFRTAFQYQSTMYNVLGFAVESASGMPWETFVQKRIFQPLGMRTAVCTTREADQTEDRAHPHRLDERGLPREVPEYRMDQPDAAGSIYASAADLARWLLFHLHEGRVGEKRLISRNQLHETHTPQMVMPFTESEHERFPYTHQMSYGMGWAIYDYRGRRVLAHTGVIDGFRTHLVLIPGDQLGVVVLSNLHATSMNLALANTLVDRFLDFPPEDWYRRLRRVERKQRVREAEAERARLARRRPDTHPSRPLSAFVGAYEHPAYGRVQINLDKGTLVWRWGNWNGQLVHFHYNTFLLPLPLLGNPEAIFSLNPEGAVDRMRITGEVDLTFRRVEE
jgi:CubicO group peptidase (beta-lactamase class C family)